ncbi:MAG: FHA domain-containing protein [Phycisphaeraceae bacterium]|nr:FHA domain-containing protein [Phycisphaerae bacterium]MBX3393469.1 FHA domain-containing protein [Phycisphaeraceae bacterium]HRJ50129.1 FHA domain-containing protein [Phycisphaerales bacterium]
MDTTLVLITSDFMLRPIPLTRPRTVIGRQTDCHIRIPTGNVSRQHCEVVLEGATLSVRDLGSSNGTYVNRRKVSRAALRAGDLVGVGNCVFVVQIDGDPDDIDAEEAYEDGVIATAAPGGPAEEAPTTTTSVRSAPSARPSPADLDEDDDEDDDSKDDSDAFDFDFSDDDDEQKKPGR